MVTISYSISYALRIPKIYSLKEISTLEGVRNTRNKINSLLKQNSNQVRAAHSRGRIVVLRKIREILNKDLAQCDKLEKNLQPFPQDTSWNTALKVGLAVGGILLIGGGIWLAYRYFNRSSEVALTQPPQSVTNTATVPPVSNSTVSPVSKSSSLLESLVTKKNTLVKYLNEGHDLDWCVRHNKITIEEKSLIRSYDVFATQTVIVTNAGHIL